MDVFISWSGKSSRILAEALCEYFPMIHQDIIPFISKEIPKGADWNTEIGNRLKNTKFGIICLTPDNLTKPWLLFESGAISVNIDKDDGSGSHVATLLLNMKASDINFPLGQFQATLCTKKDILNLLKDINKFTEKTLDENSLTKLFDKFWPEIEIQINEAKNHIGENAEIAEKRSQEEILDELVKGDRITTKSLGFIIDVLGKIDENTSPKTLQDVFNSKDRNFFRQGIIGSNMNTDVSAGTNENYLRRTILTQEKDNDKE